MARKPTLSYRLFQLKVIIVDIYLLARLVAELFFHQRW
jgi:hypothetical protein